MTEKKINKIKKKDMWQMLAFAFMSGIGVGYWLAVLVL